MQVTEMTQDVLLMMCLGEEPRAYKIAWTWLALTPEVMAPGCEGDNFPCLSAVSFLFLFFHFFFTEGWHVISVIGSPSGEWFEEENLSSRV